MRDIISKARRRIRNKKSVSSNQKAIKMKSRYIRVSRENILQYIIDGARKNKERRLGSGKVILSMRRKNVGTRDNWKQLIGVCS
jgi:hypothetical protein